MRGFFRSIINGAHQSRHGKTISDGGEEIASDNGGNGISESCSCDKDGDMQSVSDIADDFAFSLIDHGTEEQISDGSEERGERKDKSEVSVIVVKNHKDDQRPDRSRLIEPPVADKDKEPEMSDVLFFLFGSRFRFGDVGRFKQGKDGQQR